MVRKYVTLGLIFLLLFIWTGVAFSGMGFKAKNIRPIRVFPEKAHPWQDDLNKPVLLSSSYSNLDISVGSSPVISTITNLFLRLCVKYTIESALDCKDLTPKR